MEKFASVATTQAQHLLDQHNQEEMNKEKIIATDSKNHSSIAN